MSSAIDVFVSVERVTYLKMLVDWCNLIHAVICSASKKTISKPGCVLIVRTRRNNYNY